MSTYGLVLLFILGTIWGSFYYVVGERLLAEKSLGGRSICNGCGRQLKWYNLVPILSWVFQGGKCSKCKTKIPISYTIVEILTGFLFIGVGVEVDGLNWSMLMMLIFVSVFIISGVTDWIEGYILDSVVAIPTLLLLVWRVSQVFGFIPIQVRGELLTTYGLTVFGWYLLSASICYVVTYLLVKVGKLGEGDVLLIVDVFLVYGVMRGSLVMFFTGILGVLYYVCKKILKGDVEREIPFIPLWCGGLVVYYSIIMCSNFLQYVP